MPAPQPTSIRLADSLKARYKRVAKAESRSLAAQIVHALIQWITWWEKSQEGKK